MNIFLTGLPQTGKSTLIQKALNALGIRPCGFITKAGAKEPDDSSNVYIHAANSHDFVQKLANRVGHRVGDGINRTAFPQVFDTVGTHILQHSSPPLILMDELGFMENEALLFQAEVLKTLDGSIPVLGVMKPKNTPFLNRVRAHEKTKLLAVTPENRDALLPELIALLKQELGL